ncbi:MAG: hypothetical protein ACTSVZ_13210 [Promethearchaeota archaeon]
MSQHRHRRSRRLRQQDRMLARKQWIAFAIIMVVAISVIIAVAMT